MTEIGARYYYYQVESVDEKNYSQYPQLVSQFLSFLLSYFLFSFFPSFFLSHSFLCHSFCLSFHLFFHSVFPIFCLFLSSPKRKPFPPVWSLKPFSYTVFYMLAATGGTRLQLLTSVASVSLIEMVFRVPSFTVIICSVSGSRSKTKESLKVRYSSLAFRKKKKQGHAVTSLLHEGMFL